MEERLEKEELTPELLAEAKRIEFPDNVIARLTGKTEDEIKKIRYDNSICAAFKNAAREAVNDNPPCK